MVVLGVVILVAAVMVAAASVLNNLGADHALTEDFTAFGYHITGSSGTVFLYGAIVGVVGMIGLSLALAGTLHNVRRRRGAHHLEEAAPPPEAATEHPAQPSTGHPMTAGDQRDLNPKARSRWHPFGHHAAPN